MSKNTLVIHSRKMAIYLQCKGFILIGVEKNFHNNRKVFLFVDSPEIRSAMSQYKQDLEFQNYLQSVKGR